MTDSVFVKLDGEQEIEVRRANVLMGSSYGRMMSECRAKLPDLEAANPDVPPQDIFVQAVMIYPGLYACSFPKGIVPTVDEYLVMSDQVATIWIEAATEQNPHWFTFSDGSETRESQKKKEKKP